MLTQSDIDQFLDHLESSHYRLYSEGYSIYEYLEDNDSYSVYELTPDQWMVTVPKQRNKVVNVTFAHRNNDLLQAICQNCSTNPCIHIATAAHCIASELPFDFEEPQHLNTLSKGQMSAPAHQSKETEIQKDDFYHLQMSAIDPNLIIRLSRTSFRYSFNNKVILKESTEPHLEFTYQENAKKKYTVHIIYDRINTFKVSCSCNQKKNPLCSHIAECFYYLHNQPAGRFYFHRFKDFTDQKNNILKTYGLTVADPEASAFEWDIDHWNGNLILTKKPSFIIPVNDPDFYNFFEKGLLASAGKTLAIRPRLPENEVPDFEIGILVNFTISRQYGFSVEPVFVFEKSNKRTTFKKLSIQNTANLPYLQSLPDDVYNLLLSISDDGIHRETGIMAAQYTNHVGYHLSNTEYLKIRKHLFITIEQLLPFLTTWPYVYMHTEGTFASKNLMPVKFSNERIKPSFIVRKSDRFIEIHLRLNIANPESPISIYKDFFIFCNNIFYLTESFDDLVILSKFSGGKLMFPLPDARKVLLNVIAPLKNKYSVDIEQLPNIQYTTAIPYPRVTLEEANQTHLVLRPQFQYDDTVVNLNNDHAVLTEDSNGVTVTIRNKEEENSFHQYLSTLHPKFQNQKNNPYYTLPFHEVMVNNWFINALQQIQQAGFPVYGLQQLNKFRYNTNHPKFEIKASSGVDWFDLSVSAMWGDQQIKLRDLRQAIANKQTTVLLGDGTLGLIPEEWLKQYAPLLTIGTVDKDSIRISKLHYLLLDDIDAKLNSVEVQQEIAEKKNRLLNYDTLATIKPSKKLTAQLRPYQLTGFQWLQTLEQMGWGGCLADDMGLGKTLQTITFLQYLKEKHPGSTHLVVCPTSLIYNWESEIQKFCPSLQYHCYYGVQRSFDDEHMEKFDVVLTTYGMVRNDLEHLKNFNWHYVILDESQAIKNPDALITKALLKLSAKNKLILSGTPIQNNTYDLYAQFTFLNPGFLGNREFFKNEFANAIDRNGDKEKTQQLKKMLHPFMLRRTKEQVATDLPDKTETILWCTLAPDQRKAYNELRDSYRESLLQKIDESGMGNAGMLVLEGLLRLRQLCDHPALLKTDELPNCSSAKTEELMREVQENTGNHKLLIFSQFTEMLNIIRKELELLKIKCCYLDGSTPAAKRKELVEEFQTNDSIKIFLISLKAGGVGLNLTAADYVYLVDPWWNPATEQQAIDRTHRIGQSKKIFAYKMICKDTVEEKILQLQEKKKTLAQDLVGEDSGFMKKLTRDDIAFLFS